MRKSYMIDHEYWCFKIISFLNSLFRVKYKIKQSKGVLGDIDEKKCKLIIDKIASDGYFVFDNKISDEIITKLYRFAENTPLNYLELNADSNVTYSKNKETYKTSSFKSNRHQFNDTKSLFESDEATRLYFDENFLHIANEYLNCKPWVDIFTMWWSNPINNISEEFRDKFKDSAAQLFHYDLDRIKFVKFFIYLTDVDEENGPHVYVKGTHLRPQKYLKSDDRYSDELIAEHKSKDIITLSGKKGTIMAVDTRGLHKGLELKNGERLILQLQFTNSLFGTKNYNEYNNKYLTNLKLKNAETYSLFVKFSK